MNNQEQKERRKYQRYLLREDILINGIVRAYSQNIGEGGMFLCTLYPFEKDSVIDVSISPKFTVKAIVRNYQPGIGMSIEFIDTDNDQKIMIKKFIEERLEASKKSNL
jgi:hypothetical protein